MLKMRSLLPAGPRPETGDLRFLAHPMVMSPWAMDATCMLRVSRSGIFIRLST